MRYFAIQITKEFDKNLRLGGYKNLQTAINALILRGSGIVINQARRPVAVVRNNERVK